MLKKTTYSHVKKRNAPPQKPSTSQLWNWYITLFSFSHQYEDFRAKKREVGYAEEDLKESYGFLLFDSTSKVKTWSLGTPEKVTCFNKKPHDIPIAFVFKAHALAETGLLTGNSPCTTLGDPNKGTIQWFIVIFPLFYTATMQIQEY